MEESGDGQCNGINLETEYCDNEECYEGTGNWGGDVAVNQGLNLAKNNDKNNNDDNNKNETKTGTF